MVPCVRKDWISRGNNYETFAYVGKSTMKVSSSTMYEGKLPFFLDFWCVPTLYPFFSFPAIPIKSPSAKLSSPKKGGEDSPLL